MSSLNIRPLYPRESSSRYVFYWVGNWANSETGLQVMMGKRSL